MGVDWSCRRLLEKNLGGEGRERRARVEGEGWEMGDGRWGVA